VTRPWSKSGFALPSVLFVVAMVTLVFLVAIEALASLAAETRQAVAATRFQAAALTAEADVAYEASVLPLGARAILRSDLRGAPELLALDGAPYALGSGATVATQDEGGLINVDALSIDQRARFFAVMGVAPADQAAMTDRFADFVDADDLRRPLGAERDDYLRAGLPPPPNANLMRRDQLEGVMGWAQAVGWPRWRAFAGNVTADPSTQNTNINTATAAALEVWYGLTPAQAAEAVARRSQAPFAGISDLEQIIGLRLPSDSESVYTLPNGRFALRVEDRTGGFAYRSRIVLSPQDPDRPFWILEPALSNLTAAERTQPQAPAPAFPDPGA
jgi:type II secretory pathway component PulK